jgi:type I restriction enzyme S subunit
MSGQNEFKETGIGKIPTQWKVVQLGAMVEEVKNGFASGKRDANGIVQMRMNNVTTDGHLVFDSFLKVPVPDNINEFLLKEDDLLFNNTNSIDLVGKSAIFKNPSFPCTFSNHFTRIRFRDGVLPEWVLFQFIRLWRKGFFRSVAIRHVGQAAVQTKYLTSLEIALPPLPEQKRIAEILFTVDQAIEEVDKAIEKTQRLKKGLMQELLTKGIGHKEFKDTEIGRIPKNWEIVRILEIGKIATGKTPSTSNRAYWNGDIPFITPAHIKEGRYVYQTERCVTSQGAQEIGFILPANAVLVVCIGSTIGKTGLTYKESVTNQQINSVVCNDGTSKHYVYYATTFRANLLRSFSGVAAVPIIKKSLFEQFKIPLPPLPEQQKIAEILSGVDERLELLRKRKERLGKIKKGLMNDLLTGKKRVKL